MAVKKSFFWNGDDEYGEEELGVVFDATMRSGVGVSDGGVLDYPVSGANGVITVGAGRALMAGRWHYESSETSYSISPSAGYSRIDRMVVYSDFVNKITGIKLKPGTAAISPVAPSLQRDDTMYEISLASIEITTGGSITVTDERSNSDLCGAIRMRDCSEFDAYLRKIDTSFTNWFNQQQEKGWRRIAIQQSNPTEPVAGEMFFKLRTDVTTNNSVTLYYYDSEGIINLLAPHTWGDSVDIYANGATPGAYKHLDKLVFPEICGVKMSGDVVKSGAIPVVPFTSNQKGFYTDTFYSTLSSGRIYISKSGIYEVHGFAYISDGASVTSSWHVSVQKNSLLVTETFGIPDGNQCSVSCSGMVRCEQGDALSLYVYNNSSNLWRLDGDHTFLQVRPISLD